MPDERRDWASDNDVVGRHDRQVECNRNAAIVVDGRTDEVRVIDPQSEWAPDYQPIAYRGRPIRKGALCDFINQELNKILGYAIIA